MRRTTKGTEDKLNQIINTKKKKKLQINDKAPG
jgi:hypothetical protein